MAELIRVTCYHGKTEAVNVVFYGPFMQAYKIPKRVKFVVSTPKDGANMSKLTFEPTEVGGSVLSTYSGESKVCKVTDENVIFNIGKFDGSYSTVHRDSFTGNYFILLSEKQDVPVKRRPGSRRNANINKSKVVETETQQIVKPETPKVEEDTRSENTVLLPVSKSTPSKDSVFKDRMMNLLLDACVEERFDDLLSLVNTYKQVFM